MRIKSVLLKSTFSLAYLTLENRLDDETLTDVSIRCTILDPETGYLFNAARFMDTLRFYGLHGITTCLDSILKQMELSMNAKVDKLTGNRASDILTDIFVFIVNPSRGIRDFNISLGFKKQVDKFKDEINKLPYHMPQNIQRHDEEYQTPHVFAIDILLLRVHEFAFKMFKDNDVIMKLYKQHLADKMKPEMGRLTKYSFKLRYLVSSTEDKSRAEKAFTSDMRAAILELDSFRKSVPYSKLDLPFPNGMCNSSITELGSVEIVIFHLFKCLFYNVKSPNSALRSNNSPFTLHEAINRFFEENFDKSLEDSAIQVKWKNAINAVKGSPNVVKDASNAIKPGFLNMVQTLATICNIHESKTKLVSKITLDNLGEKLQMLFRSLIVPDGDLSEVFCRVENASVIRNSVSKLIDFYTYEKSDFIGTLDIKFKYKTYFMRMTLTHTKHYAVYKLVQNTSMLEPSYIKIGNIKTGNSIQNTSGILPLIFDKYISLLSARVDIEENNTLLEKYIFGEQLTAKKKVEMLINAYTEFFGESKSKVDHYKVDHLIDFVVNPYFFNSLVNHSMSTHIGSKVFDQEHWKQIIGLESTVLLKLWLEHMQSIGIEDFQVDISDPSIYQRLHNNKKGFQLLKRFSKFIFAGSLPKAYDKRCLKCLFETILETGQNLSPGQNFKSVYLLTDSESLSLLLDDFIAVLKTKSDFNHLKVLGTRKSISMLDDQVEKDKTKSTGSDYLDYLDDENIKYNEGVFLKILEALDANRLSYIEKIDFSMNGIEIADNSDSNAQNNLLYSTYTVLNNLPYFKKISLDLSQNTIDEKSLTKLINSLISVKASISLRIVDSLKELHKESIDSLLEALKKTSQEVFPERNSFKVMVGLVLSPPSIEIFHGFLKNDTIKLLEKLKKMPEFRCYPSKRLVSTSTDKLEDLTEILDCFQGSQWKIENLSPIPFKMDELKAFLNAQKTGDTFSIQLVISEENFVDFITLMKSVDKNKHGTFAVSGQFIDTSGAIRLINEFQTPGKIVIDLSYSNIVMTDQNINLFIKEEFGIVNKNVRVFAQKHNYELGKEIRFFKLLKAYGKFTFNIAECKLYIQNANKAIIERVLRELCEYKITVNFGSCKALENRLASLVKEENERLEEKRLQICIEGGVDRKESTFQVSFREISQPKASNEEFLKRNGKKKPDSSHSTDSFLLNNKHERDLNETENLDTDSNNWYKPIVARGFLLFIILVIFLVCRALKRCIFG